MSLQGVRALVTGANQGFGEAVARRFVQDGAQVFLCARNGDRLAAVGHALRTLAASPDMVQWATADVSRQEDAAAVVAAATEAFGGLDTLVCNAGVYGPKGRIEDVDWQEWADAIAVNLGGAVLCCRAVLPQMRARGCGSIILLSGGGATKPMPFLSAYAASKAALVRFGETLAAEVADAGITVNAVAPGALNTRLLTEVLEAGAEKVGEAFYQQALQQQASGGTPLDTGASLCAFLASTESRGITGRLISAVWDPWASLPARAEQLRTSDIYTLRRIVPEDRGQSWESPS